MTDFFSNILVSSAFAQGSGAAPSTGGFTSFVPLILIFLVFYFLLIRPQQKKIKEHQTTLGALKKGDKISTSSGIYGVINSIDEKENLVHLEIADDVIIKINKQAVAEVVQPKEKTKEAKATKKKSKK